MDPETREYLEQLRGDFAAIRGEFAAMRGEFAAVRGEFAAVRGDVAAMREEMDSRFDSVDRRIAVEHETTRRYFDIVAEGLRHDLQAVAEGVLSNTRAIDELRSDVYRDMNAGFGLVHLAFVDVRRQLVELRDPGAPR